MTDRELMQQALEALESEYKDRTSYGRAKRAANATCGSFKTSNLSELIESGYMHGMGTQTNAAITALREALAAPQPAQPAKPLTAAEKIEADFEAWLNSDDRKKEAKGKEYPITYLGMDQIARDCMLHAWKAALGIKAKP